MPNEEEDIPAFSTWKMCCDTIPELIRGECSDASFKRLLTIIQSKEFHDIYIYRFDLDDPEVPANMNYKYKAFITWLLGQFFYLICCEKFSKLHNVIIDTQLCILDNLSRTHLYIHRDLATHYCRAFCSLVDYCKSSLNKIKLEIFVTEHLDDFSKKLDFRPVEIEMTSRDKCVSALSKLLKLIKYFLMEHFKFYNFESHTYATLNSLVYILCEGESVAIKLDVIDIFLDLLLIPIHKFKEYNSEIKGTFFTFSSLFEQFIHKLYGSQVELKAEDWNKFESMLISYLEMKDDLKVNFKNVKRINQFIFNIALESSKVPSEKLQSVSARNLDKVTLNDLISYVPKFSNFSSFPLFYCFKQQIVRDVLKYEANASGIKVYKNDVSDIWCTLHRTIMEKFNEMDCKNSCEMDDFYKYFRGLTNMLLHVKLEIVKVKECSYPLHFFEEKDLLLCFIKKILNHSNKCDDTGRLIKDASDFFIIFPLLTGSQNIDIIFNFLAYPLLKPSCYENDNQLSDRFFGEGPTGDVKMAVRSYYKLLCTQSPSQSSALHSVEIFLKILSSGLEKLNSLQLQTIERCFFKICQNILKYGDPDCICLVIKSIPHILTLFENTDGIITSIWMPLFSLGKRIIEEAASVIPNLLCCTNSDFVKALNWEKYVFESNICCERCFFDGTSIKKEKTELLEDMFGETAVGVNFSKINISNSIGNFALKELLPLLVDESTNTRIRALETLPFFSSHVLQFHSANVAKVWVQLAGDENANVRNKFAKVVGPVIKHIQENRLIFQDVRTEVFNVIFTNLLSITKKSLKFSDFELQETLLSAIEQISKTKSDTVTIETMKILICLIMIPTSKYSIIAVNKCFKLAERQNSRPATIYSQNKKELCKVIVHYCYVNQALINYDLSTSLKKVSLMLGFFGSKDFVARESNYLLPFLVSETLQTPAVTELIQEMAALLDLELADMLATKYGYIFIHIFLEEMPIEDFKKCMIYLERITGMSGPTLRKRNFRIILNELLLNFHEKKEKVIMFLKLLADEDPDVKLVTIPDYLQSHFLGVLLSFDVKMMKRENDKILLSLADLFRFMGSKYIMPLRFKIIAMLQTINNGHCRDSMCIMRNSLVRHYDIESFGPQCDIWKQFRHTCKVESFGPRCEVWNAFIHTCEIESLGPQLALIFVSLLSLLDHCPYEINDIFKYLIVENEAHMKNYIPDLFFVNDLKVDHQVLLVIRKYQKLFERTSLKEKIVRFLKYLTHEAVEVRIQGLKQLKTYLEQNREELDKMILDYNGIDSTIVELVDILTLGCRGKNLNLKLTSGEVLGELGAIEPSHLPRRYAHDERSFSFFINEDSFIVSCLNELIKAMQAEKNTQSMNRYALAIQEILKTFDISPDQASTKLYLWNEFPEAQREVMLPLLSSRYMIALPVFSSNLPTPIYGSSSGASFQTWLYNWTSSLVSSLPTDRKAFLKFCLPSMKYDNHILMIFLPHILLHALLEGTDRITEKSFAEIQTVTSCFTKKRILDPKVLNLRPIPLPGWTPEPQVITAEEKQMQCTKVVFLMLDFLDRWVREWQWQKGLTGSTNEQFKTIKHFQNELCKLQLAKCNYHCGEYPRALMYLEDYITENKAEMCNHLSFLAEVYAQLEEPDGVDGVTTVQQNEPSIEQRILALEVSGKLADATTCYERMLQPLKLHHIQGLVQCYLDLDNVNTALNFLKGALENQPEFGNMLLEMQAEPLWRLGQYDELDSLLKKPTMTKNKSWGVQVGKALLFFKNGERNEFQNVVDGLQKQQVISFGAASLDEGAYQHGYAYISKLHALNELQQVENIVSDLLLKPNDRQYAENLMKKLMNEWLLRIKVVQESVRIVEPLLCLRRVSLNLAKKIAEEKFPAAVPFLNSLIGECWLLSAKTARSVGMHQQAYTYTIKAEEYAPPTLFIEKAKLHWMREEHEQALTTLRRGLEVILPENCDVESLLLEQRKICAEARLLVATYNDAISNVDEEVNLQNYRKAIEVYKEWEKSLVCLARYYDKIFENYVGDDRDSRGSDMQLHMINNFGKSLQYGTNYIYQSMPRLLSIWFDYGTRLLNVTISNVKEERKNILLSMTKLIDNFLEKLPAYVFLTAFSQLVSRICHPQKEVYIELKSIIIKLLQQYPQQSLWMIISVIKSSYSVRSKRCAEILCDPRLKTATLTKLIKDFTSLAEKLIELCNKEISADVSTTKISSLVRALPRMLGKEDFSEIMMPTYKFRKLILPNPDFSSTQHNPFPNHYVHICGIEEEMTILPSLQRPRKITLKGSDGKGYIYMLKPKDDLRKDFRLMEFNDIVNQLLAREGEARQRRLNIRLYSVAPLNEECGLIEWIPNLIGLRPVLNMLYKQRGLAMKSKELKEACCNNRDSLEKKRDVFTKKLLPRHPPILGEWFRKTFPDAQSWLTARTAYIRTTAVMSMAGYILGLGDRHGENILLDSTCGDVMHVDFNCLFNKGEKFDWPERVPFRLTHNMVAAMGPLGVEGVFRKSCACTLRVLRMNTNTLMSIVAPFVYDPLVSWPRNVPALPTIHNAERTNEEAVDHIKNIELRLQGKVKRRTRTLLMALSVEGQTNYLITEAVSIDNLCQMYIGWGPYL